MGRNDEAAGTSGSSGLETGLRGSSGLENGSRGSALIKAVGTLDGAGRRRASAGPLRSWVIGWTHRFDPRTRAEDYFDEAAAGPPDSEDLFDNSRAAPSSADTAALNQPTAHQTTADRTALGHTASDPAVPDHAASDRTASDQAALDCAVPDRIVSDCAAPDHVAPDQPIPSAVVRRLVEAVVDVLLERRSAEQVRRWVSREVFGLLSTVAQRRATIRFASRSTVRSIRLHTPAIDAVESTVLVQDGPRVRAVALRFERSALPTAAQIRFEPGRGEPIRYEPDRLEWRCTALQFA